MKKIIACSLLLISAACTLVSFSLPKGWFKAGSMPDKYDMGVDVGMGESSRNAATIKSIDNKVRGFGTLMQECSAEKYRGKRVRMTGYMKSDNVKKWASFWFRVDEANSSRSLAFDNMQNRAIRGTTEYSRYEIVLDVPEEASNLAYGALLTGTGQVWFDNIRFEIVDRSVHTTGL